MKNEGPICGACVTIFSFLCGGVLGAAVALLVAPRSGRETRQQIMGAADEVKGKAQDHYNQIKETVTSALEHGKDVITEKKEHIAKGVQEGIDAFKQKG
jgi:gas vesicle protein